MDKKNKYKDIDALLNKILTEDSKSTYYQFNELFEQRLAALDITKHQALKILGIDHKTLDSFLAGDSKKIDVITIIKFSDFLEIPADEILKKYSQLVSSTHNESISTAKKRSFIVNNFNLTSLKKIGFIESINDFEHIEKRVNEFFGYESIFEHSKHKITAAFSSGKRASNKENLSFWYGAACQSLEKTPNPNEFNRDALVEYFPQIRWHSLNVENGLLIVAQELFKMGITVIVVPKFTPDVHLRGATLPYREKPCIVLSNYTPFYATLWFALIHELYHVLYDWDEIKNEKYHISGETTSINISEEEANNFAREYLFSAEKLKAIKPRIDEPAFVKYFAEQNHVHHSIIYTFYSWDAGEEKCYARFHKYLPEIHGVFRRFNAEEFLKYIPIKKISQKRNLEIYN